MIPCLKRTVHCIILDDRGQVLAWGRNTCQPPDGRCARLNIISTDQGEYDASGCGSVHAEIAAVNMLKEKGVHRMYVHSAILTGHDFCCDSCIVALREAGVGTVTVLPSVGASREVVL